MKEKDRGDVLLAKEANKAQRWVVEGDDEKENEEVYLVWD